MWFLAIAIGIPAILLILDVLTPGSHGFGELAGLWLIVAVPAIAAYGFARLVGRAWRDGERAEQRRH